MGFQRVSIYLARVLPSQLRNERRGGRGGRGVCVPCWVMGICARPFRADYALFFHFDAHPRPRICLDLGLPGSTRRYKR